jgi:DNA-binding NarL/FixJ family response regulator
MAFTHIPRLPETAASFGFGLGAATFGVDLGHVDRMWGTLTRTELEVIELLVTGMTNREIGGELGVGTETVKSHVSNVLVKLGVRNRTALAAIAGARGDWERRLVAAGTVGSRR